jgi:hypothetical protein
MGSNIRHRRELSVGPLQVLFDNGDLRYFRVGGVEVLRRIYVAVRDAEWDTIPPRIEDVKVEASGPGFSARFRCRHERGDIGYEWVGTIDARSGGTGESLDVTVRYEMAGRAVTTYRTNRTGICVLHPIQHCAGLPCRVEHTDGKVEASNFPRLISPGQPFFDVRAITHEPVEGVRVDVRFEGEVFETEDQRNWTDGSFKTYGRPLALPFPYELKAAEEVRHVVTVRVTGNVPARRATGNEIRVGEKVGRLPAVRVAQPGGGSRYFADVNRKPPAAGVIAYPIHPQVHSTDDLSIVENLQGQGDTVRTARAFAPDALIEVGQITFHRTPAERPDPRELTPLGAAWTLASIKQLAEAGADSLTYGVHDVPGTSRTRELLRRVAEWEGADLLSCESSDGLAFESLAVRKGERLGVWVASLKDRPVTVNVAGLPDGGRALTLSPYEVVMLNYEGKERR